MYYGFYVFDENEQPILINAQFINEQEVKIDTDENGNDINITTNNNIILKTNNVYNINNIKIIDNKIPGTFIYL